MNWYSGDIAQAVAESRQRNAIFVVYVAGKDPNTERLTALLNDEKIRSQLESERFVAIRIESDSQSYMQFASIYQVVPIPSIFFIGMSGVPIEIGTSILQNVDELEEKIRNVLTSQSMSQSSSSSLSSTASASLIAAEKMEADKGAQGESSAALVDEKPLIETETVGEAPLENRETAGASTTAVGTSAKTESQQPQQEEEEIVCEGGVCYKKPKETPTPTENPEQSNQINNDDTENAQNTDLNTRLEATRKLLEQKRRERVEEEKLLEKEQEIRRRREGREMQHLQEWQREQELKDLMENIRREKLEEQAARERIRAQIAADRVERAQKFAPPATTAEGGSGVTAATGTATTEKGTKSSASTSTTKGDTVRLQFRLPNGDVHTGTFKPNVSVLVVRDYVGSTLLAGVEIHDFMLATAYPKYEFTLEDNEKTLLDMGLFPSAVILVITKASSKPTAIIARSGGVINIIHTLILTMLSPVFSIYNYLRNVVTGRNNEGAAVDGAQKRAHEDAQTNNEASKRRNLDRFMTGPSTSKEGNDNRDEQTHDQKPYRRYGTSNVHRLSDKRKDSDDENATWNGNSTQQQ